MKPEPIQSAPIVFVVGFYKTGTSLATAIVEDLGAYNPAAGDNPHGWGRGLTVDRYPTRESSLLRKLDEKCVRRLGYSIRLPDANPLGRDLYLDMAAAALQWSDRPSVVKDPALTWTLPAWIGVCRRLAIPMRVVLTHRSRNMTAALQRAAYTRGARHWMDLSTARIHDRFLDSITLLRACRIPSLVVSHEELTRDGERCRLAMSNWLRASRTLFPV